MPALKTYDLFISHAWDYNEDYYKMVNYLKTALLFSWRNYSVPEHDPLPMNKLAERLYNQIRPVNAVIIVAGMYVPRSDWILTEIDIAKKLNKPIIGVKPRGAQVVPTVVQSVSKEIVGWNTDSIVNAIRRWSI
jgi:hypothetical protein